ncbi:TrlF family AAA-like ATPase [Modestobacter sp. SSW1-42]|uniref:TrlF family AAA-like ATPase n=1 Tax=Modestobacter sp. SSW1-42 TaxID=596372 RepID=UPI0039877A9D
MHDSGAHYRRTDLQVHTPRDAAWKGPRPSDDGSRRAYAESFVAACREKGLQAVAITDHHDLCMVRHIRNAANAETDSLGNPLPGDERLVVFPGIELTLGVPCQALLILDADYPEDRFDGVLEALAISIVSETQDRLPAVSGIEHITSLKALYDHLDQRDYIRGRYIVLPNVTDSGHQTLLRTGLHGKYKEMPCVGGYLDGSIEKLGSGNRDIIAGKAKAYGNKRIAVFQTSDARSSNFASLGKFSTWIKWSVPTAEAIRQACLAEESRIAQAQPQIPTVFVSHLQVSTSRFLGPLDLRLNPQYNAVIGGRGTGKSTILEYIRWALCDDRQAQDVAEELADPAARRKQLIDATLGQLDASVDVHLVKNGIPHVVRRYARTGEVLIQVGDGPFEKARDSDVRALLPIQAYSQKQLSSVSVRRDELIRFVTSPIEGRLRELQARLEEVEARTRQNYAALERSRLLERAITRATLEEASLGQQAANLRAELSDVSAEDRATLDLKPHVDAARDTAQQWDDSVARTATELADLALAAQVRLGQLAAPLPEALQSDESLAAKRATASAFLNRAVQLAEAAAATFSSDSGVRVAYDVAGQAWDARVAAFEAQYAEVKAKSSVHEARLQQLEELERGQAALRSQIRRQQEERSALGDPSAEHQTLRVQWLNGLSERSVALEEQCARLSTLSDGLLRATVNRSRGVEVIGDRVRAVAQGSGLQRAKVENFVAALATEVDPLASWEKVLEDFELLVGLDDSVEVTSEMIPMAARLLGLPEVKRFRARLTPDSWLDLALTRIEDQPVFEYRTRESEYIDFSLASAGQQATALLRALLNEAGPPLVIDQPEDDLDSQVIQDVVTLLWRAKGSRQIIFSSHNANLVVNGDAELVICCDYRTTNDQSGGRIKLTGAIDGELVRAEITKVMEGGEKAFRLRQEKYGF